MVDLKRLRAFVAVAERLSISRAADVLYVSQSALSRQIQGLESDLGIALFDRIGKRIALTAEGEDLLPRAQALLDDAYDLSSRLDATARGHLGLLRIGATPQTIETLLSHVLRNFREKWRAIEIALVEGSNDFLLDQVDAGAVHVAIAALPQHHELDGIDLFSARLFAVLPSRHPLAKQARIDVKALAEYPLLLLLREGFMTRDLFAHACAKAGVRPRSILESSSTQTLCALARTGHGIAIVSSTGVQPQKGSKDIPLIVGERVIRQTVSAVWNPRRHRSNLVEPLLQELTAFVTHSPLAARFRD